MADIGAPGASQGGQGSGMGSGHGSGNKEGNNTGGGKKGEGDPVAPGASSSSGNLGDVIGALGNLVGGLKNFVGVQQDETSQEIDETTTDVNYSAYDNPAYDSAAVEAQVMGPPSMQSPAYDSAAVEAQVMGPPSFGAVAQEESVNRNVSRSAQERAMDDAVAIGAKRTNRTAYKGPGKRGSAPPGYERQEDNTINIKEETVKSFVDSLQSFSRTRKERAIRAFLDKHKMGLAQLARNNAKNLDMGILGAVPGLGLLSGSRNLLVGLFESMGFSPQIDTPAMQALMQEAIRAGVLDKETSDGQLGQIIEEDSSGDQ